MRSLLAFLSVTVLPFRLDLTSLLFLSTLSSIEGSLCYPLPTLARRFWFNKSVGETNLENTLAHENLYLSNKEKKVKVLEFV